MEDRKVTPKANFLNVLILSERLLIMPPHDRCQHHQDAQE